MISVYNTHTGRLRAVSDSSGAIVKEIQYDSFGQIILDSNKNFVVPFGFASGLYDQHTKLSRFGYHDYDAKTGKWTAKDPIGFSGRDVNLYGYVVGDPINLSDPNGLIRYNKPPPATVPVKGKTKEALQCLEKCLQSSNPNIDLLVTGGAEKTGHSKNSHHSKGEACDIAGPKYQDDIFKCAEECNFKAGQYEDFPRDNADHWHFQMNPGNGLSGIKR